ncbi:MAG: FUSC family protein [Actinomycetes bacterium]
MISKLSEVFRHSGARVAWRGTLTALAAFLIACGAAYALGLRPGAGDLQATATGRRVGLDYDLLVLAKVIPAGLVAIFVVLTSLAAAPGRPALRTSMIASLATIGAMLLGWVASGSALAAGVVMAAMMTLTALSVRQTPGVRAVGMLTSSVYFWIATCGFLVYRSAAEVIELAVIGCASALLILGVVQLLRARFSVSPPPAPANPAPADAGASFFAAGPTMRYALMRGLLIGGLMGAYVASGDHDVFWVMLSAWIVLLPAPEATWDKALRRAVGVLFGCALVVGLSQVLAAFWMLWLGLVALLVGSLWIQRNYAVFQAAATFLVVALTAEMHRASTLDWAVTRLVDNVIGIGLALSAAHLVVRLPNRRSVRVG